MAPIIPDPKRIKSFPTAAAFERWLGANHDKAPELWLKMHKKASGLPTVTYAEALDIALCYGWIDGLRKSLDATSFLQRFTPRTRKSLWSQINREHVARLISDGRMTPHGMKQVEAARADGRWAAAYGPIGRATAAVVPDDLKAAIAANRKAQRTFETLGHRNLFYLSFTVNRMKTAAGRARKISELVSRLEQGRRIVPEPRTP